MAQAAEATLAEQQVVVFAVGSQQYGVPIGLVQEVLVWSEPTPLPQVPPGVEGVINLRGRAVPVLDLGTYLGVPRTKAGPESRIVVVELSGGPAGLVVDEVTEVLRLASGVLESPGSLISGCRSPLLQGIAKLEGRMVLLLAPERLATMTGGVGDMADQPRGG